MNDTASKKSISTFVTLPIRIQIGILSSLLPQQIYDILADETLGPHLKHLFVYIRQQIPHKKTLQFYGLIEGIEQLKLKDCLEPGFQRDKEKIYLIDVSRLDPLEGFLQTKISGSVVFLSIEISDIKSTSTASPESKECRHKYILKSKNNSELILNSKRNRNIANLKKLSIPHDIVDLQIMGQNLTIKGNALLVYSRVKNVLVRGVTNQQVINNLKFNNVLDCLIFQPKHSEFLDSVQLSKFNPPFLNNLRWNFLKIAKVHDVGNFNNVRASKLKLLQLSMIAGAGSEDLNKNSFSRLFAPELVHLTLKISSSCKGGKIHIGNIKTPNLRNLVVQVDQEDEDLQCELDLMKVVKPVENLIKDSIWRWDVPNLSSLELSGSGALTIFKVFKDFAFVSLTYLKIRLNSDSAAAASLWERFELPSLMRLDLSYEQLPLSESITYFLPRFGAFSLQHLQLSHLPKHCDVSSISTSYPLLKTLSIYQSSGTQCLGTRFDSLESLQIHGLQAKDLKRIFSTAYYPRLKSLELALLSDETRGDDEVMEACELLQFAPILNLLRVSFHKQATQSNTQKIALRITVAYFPQLLKIVSLTNNIQWRVNNCPKLAFFKGIALRSDQTETETIGNLLTPNDTVFFCATATHRIVFDLQILDPNDYTGKIQTNLMICGETQINSDIAVFRFNEKPAVKEAGTRDITSNWKSYCKMIDGELYPGVLPYFNEKTRTVAQKEKSVAKFIDQLGNIADYSYFAKEMFGQSGEKLRELIESQHLSKFNSVSGRQQTRTGYVTELDNATVSSNSTKSTEDQKKMKNSDKQDNRSKPKPIKSKQTTSSDSVTVTDSEPVTVAVPAKVPVTKRRKTASTATSDPQFQETLNRFAKFGTVKYVSFQFSQTCKTHGRRFIIDDDDGVCVIDDDCITEDYPDIYRIPPAIAQSQIQEMNDELLDKCPFVVIQVNHVKKLFFKKSVTFYIRDLVQLIKRGMVPEQESPDAILKSDRLIEQKIHVMFRIARNECAPMIEGWIHDLVPILRTQPYTDSCNNLVIPFQHSNYVLDPANVPPVGSWSPFSYIDSMEVYIPKSAEAGVLEFDFVSDILFVVNTRIAKAYNELFFEIYSSELPRLLDSSFGSEFYEGQSIGDIVAQKLHLHMMSTLTIPAINGDLKKIETVVNLIFEPILSSIETSHLTWPGQIIEEDTNPMKYFHVKENVYNFKDQLTGIFKYLVCQRSSFNGVSLFGHERGDPIVDHSSFGGNGSFQFLQGFNQRLMIQDDESLNDPVLILQFDIQLSIALEKFIFEVIIIQINSFNSLI
ncbi:hypothetical protein WICPIJ_006138 [Wickerhamomyces pijperi]|uniref:Uncharacterized protein n=1 Tax=Wickerhamomyces pijperi TaxID=599730 RepID=A0A9P8Q2S4_WICPI|nr:hypothetical protein WICPIJ_006138 [Wickerhamomyces pijperi]